MTRTRTQPGLVATLRAVRPGTLATPRAWLLAIALPAFACQGPDPRIPRQVDAPKTPVVDPVVAAPKPPPPPPPAPPPPRSGAELFARTTGEAWQDRRALDRLCDTVADHAAETHLVFARPQPAPASPPSPDVLLAQLDTLATDLDSTLDLMQQVADSNAPPAENARLCLARLAQIRAELFSSPHLFKAFAPHASHPRIKNLVAVLKRSGAHLDDAARARLAELTQEAERVRLELETSPSASSARSRLVELLRIRHRIAEALGHPTFADYVAAAKPDQNPAAIATHLERLAAMTRPYLERELAGLPGLTPGGLDDALANDRAIAYASVGQEVLGPWPYRRVANSADVADLRTPPTSWWARLHAPSAPRWDARADRVTLPDPLPEPRRTPARAIGFMRQLQLASFWLTAHDLPERELGEDRLDTLWADSLERFGLSQAYPAAAWSAFTGLASSPGYHLVIDAHLERLAIDYPGADPLAPLAQWLEPQPHHTPPPDTAPTE